MKEIVRFCEKCGKPMTELFGSGRFCSRGCANSHQRSKESREKIRQIMKNSQAHKDAMEKYHKSDRWQKQREAQLRRWDDKPHYLNTIELDVTNKEMRKYREQHLVCEICGEIETCKIGFGDAKNRVRKLSRDHQPGTNHFRGLLCTRCNQSLGWYERFSSEVARYLERNIT